MRSYRPRILKRGQTFARPRVPEVGVHVEYEILEILREREREIEGEREEQVNVNGQPMAQGGGEEEVLSSHRLLQETGRSGNSASDKGEFFSRTGRSKLNKMIFQYGPFWKIPFPKTGYF